MSVHGTGDTMTVDCTTVVDLDLDVYVALQELTCLVTVISVALAP